MNKNILSTLLMFVFVACGTEKNDDKLIVGMELAYPPFETKDNEGNPMGVSVDIANALGEYLGKEVVIENTAWAGLIPALQTEKVDIIISSMTITDDRKKTVDFSDPYAQVLLALLVNTQSPVNSLEDLNQKGRIVAVKQGTTPFIFANEYLTNAKINSFTSESVAVTEVVQGKADAVIYDQLTIYKNHQLYPDTTKIVPMTMANTDVWGMAVKKGNTELLKKVNEFLAEFKSEEGYAKITQKHLTVEKEEFDKYGLSFFF